jgi:hypothetical protein
MRCHVKQRCAFSRQTEVLAPGFYEIDRLTARAIRQSQPWLVKEGEIVFKNDPEPDDELELEDEDEPQDLLGFDGYE